jgi:hypothetical protein
MRAPVNSVMADYRQQLIELGCEIEDAEWHPDAAPKSIATVAAREQAVGV